MKMQVLATVSPAFPFLGLAATPNKDEILAVVNGLRMQQLFLYSLSNAQAPQLLLEQPISAIATCQNHNLVAIGGDNTVTIYNYVTRNLINQIVFPGTFEAGRGTLAWSPSGEHLTAAFEREALNSYTRRETKIYSFDQSATTINELYVSDSLPDLVCTWSPESDLISIEGAKPGEIDIFTSTLEDHDFLSDAAMHTYGPKRHQLACWRQVLSYWYLEVQTSPDEEAGRTVACHKGSTLPFRSTIVWSPDGTKLFFINEMQGQVAPAIYDVVNNKLITITDYQDELAAARQILWTNDSRDLIIINYDGRSICCLSL